MEWDKHPVWILSACIIEDSCWNVNMFTAVDTLRSFDTGHILNHWLVQGLNNWKQCFNSCIKCMRFWFHMLESRLASMDYLLKYRHKQLVVRHHSTKCYNYTKNQIYKIWKPSFLKIINRFLIWINLCVVLYFVWQCFLTGSSHQ